MKIRKCARGTDRQHGFNLRGKGAAGENQVKLTDWPV